jgi:AhpD family alkylhydroperoxidase
MSHARSEYAAFRAQAPDIHEALLSLGKLATKAGLDRDLIELIKIRASQINGCAFCLKYHILQAETVGLSTDKISLVAVWREAPQFSERERAALAWTEALTVLGNGVGEEVYAEASAEFSEKELLYLTSAIAVINAWNRYGAAYRWPPQARPKKVQAATS